MNKITLIEDDDTHSDFIVDFPLKDISINGKRLDETYRNTKQLKLLSCFFGCIIMIILLINSFYAWQNYRIIKNHVSPNLQAGEQIQFIKPAYGINLNDHGTGRIFDNFEKVHTVIRVGNKYNRFRIMHDGVPYKFYNASDSYRKFPYKQSSL